MDTIQKVVETKIIKVKTTVVEPEAIENEATAPVKVEERKIIESNLKLKSSSLFIQVLDYQIFSSYCSVIYVRSM